MGRRLITVGLVALAVGTGIVTAAPVDAGGSPWRPDIDVVEVGDEVEVWAGVAWEHNPALGTPDDGPWHAWAVPAGSSGPWGEIPGHAVHLGEIEVVDASPGRLGPHQARFTMTVPDLAPGHYEILHCNDPCTNTLGDITWGAFQVVGPGAASDASPATAVPTTASLLAGPATTTGQDPSDRFETAFPSDELDGVSVVLTRVDGPTGGSGPSWAALGSFAVLALGAVVLVTRARPDDEST